MSQGTSFSRICELHTQGRVATHARRWVNIFRSSTEDREGVKDSSNQMGAPEKASEGRAGATRT